MGTQKNIAAQIQQAQAEYILCLKANHPTVFEQLNAWFKTAIAQGCLPRPSEHTTEAGHHRTEIWKVWTFSLDQLSLLHQAAILDGTANDCHRRTHPLSLE